MVPGHQLEPPSHLDVQGLVSEVKQSGLTNRVTISISSQISSLIIYLVHFVLRFCSRPFTLASGHESIHLCNNAVQTKYSNGSDRSTKLPNDNMWDNRMFMQFLRDQGYGEKWHTTIYPLMKRTLIGELSFSILLLVAVIDCTPRL